MTYVCINIFYIIYFFSFVTTNNCLLIYSLYMYTILDRKIFFFILYLYVLIYIIFLETELKNGAGDKKIFFFYVYYRL